MLLRALSCPRGAVFAALLVAMLLSGQAVAQTTWFVDNSFGDCPNSDGSSDKPFCSIQGGIDAAANGDSVLVLPGIYNERISFMGKRIHVRSDVDGDPGTYDPDPNGIVIDGGDGGSVVVFNTGETEESILEGFTVRNGESTRGGGIYCQGTSPLITGNIISGNRAYDYSGDNRSTSAYGGGIFCDGGSPTIVFNTVQGNSTYAYANDPSGGSNRNSYSFGGGIFCDSTQAVIADNVISGNSCTGWADGTHLRYGGGLYFLSSTAKVLRNVIDSNSEVQWGGGIYMQSCSTGMEIAENSIRGNFARTGSDPAGGGILCYDSSSTITENVITCNGAQEGGDGGGIACLSGSNARIFRNSIYNNTASEDGGGIYVDDSSSAIISNVISCNQAGSYGGGIGCRGASSNPAVRNNTVWGNEANLGGGGIYHGAPAETWTLSSLIVRQNTANFAPDQIQPATVVVRYSNIQGGWSGEGNIDINPRFVFPSCDDNCDGIEDFDFSLLPNSRCIDTGDVIDPPCCDQDRVGHPRLLDGDLDRDMRVDIGAYEFDNVRLAVSGNLTPGGQINLSISGTAGLNCLLFVSTPGQFCLEPFGCLFTDFRFPFWIFPVGNIPGNMSAPILPNFPAPATFGLQVLAYRTDPTVAGNTSNGEVITIQ